MRIYIYITKLFNMFNNIKRYLLQKTALRHSKNKKQSSTIFNIAMIIFYSTKLK